MRSSSHNVCRLTTETFDFAGVLPGTKPSSRKTAGSKARSSSSGGGGSSAPAAEAPQITHQVNGAATASAAKPAAAAGAPRVARAGAAGVPRTGSAAAAAKPLVKQGSARLTKVHSGITHAEAVQAALAASSSQQQQAQEQTAAVAAPAAAVQRPRAAFLDLQPRRRRVRDWSSEEEDSEED